MMRLPAFEVARPGSLPEAVALLSARGPEAVAFAGGTDLLPALKRGEARADWLVSLERVPDLHGIRASADGSLAVGAATTLAAVASHPAIIRSHGALAQAAALVATPQIRAAATLGGNVCLDVRCRYFNQSAFYRSALGPCLKAGGDTCHVAPGGERCWAVCSADTAPALCALDARLRLVGPGGECLVPAREFYRSDGLAPHSRLAADIVVSILLGPPCGRRSAYLKLRRRASFDFPALGVAVALAQDDAGILDASVYLGAVAPAPVEATQAAAFLRGGPATPERLARAANLAAEAARPLDNTDFSPLYRKRMAAVLTLRALQAASSAD